jgi:hypothetical protein
MMNYLVTGGYVICEYAKLREYFPEFKDIMDRLEASLIAKAAVRRFGDRFQATVKGGVGFNGLLGRGERIRAGQA